MVYLSEKKKFLHCHAYLSEGSERLADFEVGKVTKSHEHDGEGSDVCVGVEYRW